MPDPEDVVPYHFIAFVCKDGCLYELGESKITTFYLSRLDRRCPVWAMNLQCKLEE